MKQLGGDSERKMGFFFWFDKACVLLWFLTAGLGSDAGGAAWGGSDGGGGVMVVVV